MTTLDKEEDIEKLLEILRGDPSEANAKNSLIKNIKETFGNNCIEKNYSGSPFRKPNLIVLNKNGIKIILYFRYSGEKCFYGSDKNIVAQVIDYMSRNKTKKIYFYLLFMLDIPEDKIRYFPVPIFFIKNFERDISIGNMGTQYKFSLELINGKYKFKLKNKMYEDISIFETDIEGLFNENFMRVHDEEKIKYENTTKAKQELMKNLAGN